jgi:ketosteroid isomerase-like protein
MSMSEAGKDIETILGEFVDGFNTNSLDDVMSFFADSAVYEPGDGRTHRGRAAIRAAFQPQFENAFGTMRFVVSDRVVDERARKATIRWVCQHDLTTVRSFLQRWLFRALYGRSAGWYGTDTFHFDQQGKITGKFSYANYGRRPQIRRDLGAAA